VQDQAPDEGYSQCYTQQEQTGRNSMAIKQLEEQEENT